MLSAQDVSGAAAAADGGGEMGQRRLSVKKMEKEKEKKCRLYAGGKGQLNKVMLGLISMRMFDIHVGCQIISIMIHDLGSIAHYLGETVGTCDMQSMQETSLLLSISDINDLHSAPSCLVHDVSCTV